ncbi:MAG: DUF5518 domain-containing protein [Vicinamibacterales bacterium]
MTPAKTQPALLGGAVIGVLSALPVINVANCCCAWILFGGALAAYLMQQNHPEPIQTGDGAVVGLMAGAIGAAIGSLLSIPIGLMMGPFQSRMLQRTLENARDMPPEVRGFFEAFAHAPGEGGAPFILMGLGWILGFVFWMVVSSIFGTLGGILGAIMFRKAAPAPPPPLPGA